MVPSKNHPWRKMVIGNKDKFSWWNKNRLKINLKNKGYTVGSLTRYKK